MNINVGPNADSIMASNYPRLYMAITVLKIIFVLAILFVMYKLKTNEARNTELNNLRYAQLRQQAANPRQQGSQQVLSPQAFSMY
jgi:hypothetical protein